MVSLILLKNRYSAINGTMKHIFAINPGIISNYFAKKLFELDLKLRECFYFINIRLSFLREEWAKIVKTEFIFDIYSVVSVNNPQQTVTISHTNPNTSTSSESPTHDITSPPVHSTTADIRDTLEIKKLEESTDDLSRSLFNGDIVDVDLSVISTSDQQISYRNIPSQGNSTAADMDVTNAIEIIDESTSDFHKSTLNVDIDDVDLSSNSTSELQISYCNITSPGHSTAADMDVTNAIEIIDESTSDFHKSSLNVDIDDVDLSSISSSEQQISYIHNNSLPLICHYQVPNYIKVVQFPGICLLLNVRNRRCNRIHRLISQFQKITALLRTLPNTSLQRLT